MPPQLEKDDAATASGGATVDCWSEPAEKQLEGKTLSTLDLDSLGHVEHAAPPAAATNAAPAGPVVDHWTEPAEKQLEGKTLSTLDLDSLGHVVDGEAEAATTKAVESAPESSAAVCEIQNNDPKAAVGDCWSEPAEKQLEGKTLSTLDLDSLGHVVHGDAETKSDAPAGGSYWDFKERIQKTLSNLSLTDLVRGHHATTEANSDNPAEEPPKEGATVPSDTNAGAGHWFWRNPSFKNLGNLSSASLTTLEKEAKASDASQTATASPAATSTTASSMPRRPSSGGCWFWRGSNDTNAAKTDSNVSLNTLEQQARATDRAQG